MAKVTVNRQSLTIPTYGLGLPERNPLFFEKRVYQGSCGKVYPVPFIDKVYDTSESVQYDTIEMDNGLVNLTLLPEIGGRVFTGSDLTNNGYDFFYRQDVIKPALVGLAGPWISGGVEFNWPQHHRPGTYMPTDVHLEVMSDGSRIVWMSEHDPMNRLKGMHGVCLRPGSALIELKARLFNRTPFTQTFLWWANVAARVHDNYQSFFPPDVHYVADHAVRAQSSFPIAKNAYYGIDYANRPGANDLGWYKNIPVPTSYMVCDTQFDFFGGYDYEAQGGFIHVADRHIAPGKKQWTWGNHEFGWAWDRELTDANGPYVELMAGVYTDNQPDFTYLAPYETKTFSQFWWPYQTIGPVQNATKEAAIRLVVNDDRSLDLGVAVSEPFDGARIVLRDGEHARIDARVDLSPSSPWQQCELAFEGEDPQSLELTVEDAAGRILCSYRPIDLSRLKRNRALAEEPPAPADTATIDELVLTAEHLEQYRHPTRYPEPYLEEALRRDAGHVQANIATGRLRLRQGCLDDAGQRFQKAIDRLTRRHPNPRTGEAHYLLGLARRFQNRLDEAYPLLYKATWNDAWRAPAFYELALIDCRRGNFSQAVDHCDAALETNTQNNKARIVKVLALRRLGQDDKSVLPDLLADDPLDHWARYVAGDIDGFLDKSRNDAQTILDVAYDFADGGFWDEAIAVIHFHHENDVSQVAVPNPAERSQMTHYTLAWLLDQQTPGNGRKALAAARALCPDYLFPSRPHERMVLEWALEQDGADRNAAYGLGNLYYDAKRHEDAIACWEQAVAVDPGFATARRCLGIAYWNVQRDGQAARNAYKRALSSDPEDARIFAEYDQLREKIGDAPETRLDSLLGRLDLVLSRDDATVALATLYNETGQADKALDLLREHRFHPWEGGEGQVVRQYTIARLKLGQKALKKGDASLALEHFDAAMRIPQNLGEAYHLLQAKADVNYWRGRALHALGREEEAKEAFEAAASEAGDFVAMAVTEHSELSYFRGLSLVELGCENEAKALFEDMKDFAKRESEQEGTIDYFATSLPLLLVFEDDLTELRHSHARHLAELADSGLKLLNESHA
ncbi:MAG: DUF5107 domain-containing protein [Lentisphaeria bacterium]|nr:DUF5107 domain-containing protein [Lentisphaeria bacterium]